MKKLFTFVFVIVILLSFGIVQAAEETVSIPKSQLTKEQLQKFETEKVLRDTGLSTYAGIGKEIGTAVNESLKAISTNVNEFANSKAGQVTVYLVAWKLAGKDIIKFMGGFIIFLLSTAIICWSYRKTCVTRKTLFKINADKSREYKLVNDRSVMDRPERIQLSGTRATHMGLFLVMVIVSAIIMF